MKLTKFRKSIGSVRLVDEMEVRKRKYVAQKINSMPTTTTH